MNIIVRIVRERIEAIAEARAIDPVGCAHFEPEEQSLRRVLAKLESVDRQTKPRTTGDELYCPSTATLH